MRIMAVGDSITAGQTYVGQYPGAYRIELYRRLYMRERRFSFVGQYSSGAPLLPAPAHEGVGGDTVALIAARINAALAANPPDVVLLLAGANDAIANTAGITAAYQALCVQIFTAAPQVQLVIGTPTLLTNATWNAYLTTLAAAIYSTIAPNLRALGYRVFVAPTRAAFPGSDLLADGIHPGQVGYTKLGDVWASTLLGTVL